MEGLAYREAGNFHEIGRSPFIDEWLKMFYICVCVCVCVCVFARVKFMEDKLGVLD